MDRPPPIPRHHKNTYIFSRYYFDRHFPNEICAQFYSDWLEKSCAGYSKKVFVAMRGKQPVGYITCDQDDFIKGRLSLVGVHNDFQNYGIGKLLVRHALDWFKTQGVRTVEVVTQGRNYGAQRLYQRSGFILRKSEIWYHKWF
jgi:ribosomal protein S18 acetylase RimI-like enzyme